MTDIEKKMLELIGADESEAEPKDKMSEMESSINDIVLLMAEIIGGDA